MPIKFSSTEKSPLPTHNSNESSDIYSFSTHPFGFYLATAALIFCHIYGKNVVTNWLPDVVTYAYIIVLFFSAVDKDIMLMYGLQVLSWIQLVFGIFCFTFAPVQATMRTAVNYLNVLAANSSFNCTSDILFDQQKFSSVLLESGTDVAFNIAVFLLYVGFHLFFLRKTIAAEEAKINA